MKDNYDSKRRFKDWLPKILSVLAAVILWFYVIDVKTTVEETTVYGVPIEITNFSNPQGLDIISGKDFTVDVVIRGTKSDIYDVSVSDIHASVNMSGIETSGTHPLDVDVYCEKSGVSVVNKNVSQINVNVDKRVTSVVPIKVKPYYTIEEQVYSMGDISLDYDSVQISGPQDLVGTVVEARAEVNIGQVKNTITNITGLKLYDANGNSVDSPYIKLSVDSVTVNIPVYKRQLKTVVPNFTDANYGYTYEVSPSEVIIKGDVLRVDSVNTLYTDSISEIVPSRVVKRLMLPENVTAFDVNGEAIDSVTVIIKAVEDLRQLPIEEMAVTVSDETDDEADGGNNIKTAAGNAVK